MAAATAVPPAPAHHAVAPAALWFGLFGGPAAWSIQLMANYALVAHGCFPSRQPRSTPLFGGLWTVALVVSVVAFVVSVAAFLLARRSWLGTREEHPGGREALLEVGEGRTRFMAYSGMLVSALFTAAVLMATIPLFILSPCR
jgi:hypothetical protein